MRHQGKIQEFLFTRQIGPSAWEIMPPDLILRFTDGIRIRDRHLFSCWWRQDSALIFCIRLAGDQSPVPAL